MKNFFVLHSDGTKEKFKPRFIAQTIIDETGIDEDLANKIQARISKKIYKLKKDGLDLISTADLRAEVSSQLLKEQKFDAVEKNRVLGMTVSEFEVLMENGCNDNANIGYSPEMITKYAYDSISKQYALHDMPKECADAHIEGYVHHHDLEFFHTRPNCLSGRNNIIVKDDNNNIFYISIQEFVEEGFPSEENFYVPTLNIKTNQIEWKKVLNAYLSSQCEETYLVTFNKGYSIECTSDHKFIKSHNNKPQKQYDIKVSDFNNYKDLRLCNITNLLENNSHNNYQASVLFGFFLGDGHMSPKGNVKFTFSKKDKAEYLYQLLEDLDVDFTYTIKESDDYQSGHLYSFYIKDKIYPQISKSELIKRYNFTNNLKGVLEGLINSDGHIRLDINNTLRLNFTSTNKDIFDLYQLCLLSQGIRGSINITEFDNAKHNDAYNSSSFGEKVISLLTSITLCDRFTDSIKQYNKKVKQYKDIGELRPKSIEYSGEQPVYNLTIEDNHNYMAGINGFVLTQNCMNYDLRFFAKNGLKISGDTKNKDSSGVKVRMGSVAKPAKSLEVLLNHLLQAFMAGAVVFSGGQGYVNFNTLLAPFAKGRSYKDIKQAIQAFVFNCNMSLVCRGGQILFSSIGVDLSVPDVLKNEPAIGPGGIANGVYGDYQEEADLIFRAILEVSEEKDGAGAYHRFPNILFNIREGDLDKYEGNCKLLHEKGCNNPTLYYVNCTEMERTVMGCRTALPVNYSGDYEKDSMNTGNFMYSTLNLPLIALAARDNVSSFLMQDNYFDLLRQEFYNLLGYYCDIIYDTLIYRRECVIDTIYNKHMSDFLLQEDKETKQPLWDIDRTTITIGYCGLHECLEILGKEDGEAILNFINSEKELYHEKDGLRWSVIGSPAESASHRFAEIIKEKYPDAPVQGTKDNYYLTNSSHIPVSAETDIVDHIKNAAKYHPLSLGGNILHIWLGEVWSDAEAIWSLNKKIIETGTIFWAYSKVFTYCPECGYTINDNLEVCPICGSKHLFVYDRITGYYLCIETFNNGKKQEFKDRYRQVLK